MPTKICTCPQLVNTLFDIYIYLNILQINGAINK
jgi:hypothetical protein